MQLSPLFTHLQPDYPDRRSTIARELARAAAITGAALLLSCGGSERHTEDPIALPGEPPITQLEDEADEQSTPENDEQHHKID